MGTGAQQSSLDLVTGSSTQQREIGDELYKLYGKCRDEIIGLLIDKNSYTQDQAIHAAQKLIDRVVFMAFAQDRGLLPHKLIERTYTQVVPLDPRENPRWQNFVNAFHFIDIGHKALDLPDGYNGKLFEFDSLVDNLQLEDEPWTNFFFSIGKFDFRDEGEVNVEVLGNLFERSIAELEKRRTVGLFGKQAEQVAGVMPKSAERKRFGIYYTPPEFTRFIVEQTLGQLIAERVEEQPTADAQLAALKQLKVVDPACGSGAFLVAAFDRIEEAYSRIIYTLRQEARLEEAATLERNYGDDILKDNLDGMDLSEQSIEIARLALWLRSARKARKLVDLSGNVVQGNSLVADPSIHPRAQEWKDTFPAVFASGGFDCVIGNPPWERIKLQKREFFAQVPEVILEPNAAKARELIEAFEQDRPALAKRWSDALLLAARTSDYARTCDKYPLSARGDINYAMLFAELSRYLVAPDGLVGLLVPSGIATDDTTKHFFGDLMDKKALHALYDFENRKFVFADVDGRFKFSILLMNGANRLTEEADFVFFSHSLEDLKPRDRHIKLSARDLKLLNPNTRTCPIFRSRFDYGLTKGIYRNVPVLIDARRKVGGNPWKIRLGTMFHQSSHASLFRNGKDLTSDGFHLDGNRWIRGKESYLPLYEAKMIQAYDHRAAGVIVDRGNWVRQGQTEGTPPVYHQNNEFVVVPRFWVSEHTVQETGVSRTGMLAYKNITSVTNQRTMIAAFLPYAAYVDSLNTVTFDDSTGVRRRCCLLANLNSLAYDYVARQKVGGLHLSFFIVEQISTFPP